MVLRLTRPWALRFLSKAPITSAGAIALSNGATLHCDNPTLLHEARAILAGDSYASPLREYRWVAPALAYPMHKGHYMLRWAGSRLSWRLLPRGEYLPEEGERLFAFRLRGPHDVRVVAGNLQLLHAIRDNIENPQDSPPPVVGVFAHARYACEQRCHPEEKVDIIIGWED